MILEQWCQVNSNFFYAEKGLDFDELKSYNSHKIKTKKLTQDKFDSLMEYFVFTEGYVTRVETSKGNFVFYGVTHDFLVDEIRERLIKHSTDKELYYFSNVDYFDYGFFAVGNSGKVDRLLRYNSEAMGEEEIVYWVGKPHKWEYETHTFYSKKKLEECEMSFGWSEVCDMVNFYLPFINDEVDVYGITVYSKKNNLKNVVDYILNGKPLKFTKEITHQDEMGIFKMLVKNDTTLTSTDIFICKDYVEAYNYLMFVDDMGGDPSSIKAVSSKFKHKVLAKNFNLETCCEMIYSMIADYPKAKGVTMADVVPLLESVPSCEHRLAQIFTEYDYATRQYVITFSPGRMFDAKDKKYIPTDRMFFRIGKKYNRKTFTKIYKQLKKLLAEYK